MPIRPALFMALLALATASEGQELIQTGQTVRGTLQRGDLVLASDRSLYDDYFLIAPAGQRLIVNVESESFDTYLLWGRGFAARFAQLASDDDGGGGTNSRLVIDVPESATYTVRVNALASHGAGPYLLTVTEAGGAPVPEAAGTAVSPTAASPVPASRAPRPVSGTVVLDTCPGEYCSLGGPWTAQQRYPVYDTIAPARRIAYHLDVCEHVEPVRALTRIQTVGMFRSVRPFAAEDFRGRYENGPAVVVPARDTLLVLAYEGEGHYRFWWRGRVIQGDAHSSQGELVEIREGADEWWVQIRRAGGQTGWIRLDQPGMWTGGGGDPPPDPGPPGCRAVPARPLTATGDTLRNELNTRSPMVYPLRLGPGQAIEVAVVTTFFEPRIELRRAGSVLAAGPGPLAFTAPSAGDYEVAVSSTGRCGGPYVIRAGPPAWMRQLPPYPISGIKGDQQFRVRLAHIMIAPGENPTQAQRAAARRRAESLRLRAINGEDFSSLAREASDDPTARENGGDIGLSPGWHPGQEIEYYNAAMSLTPGQISPVVQTGYGYHILKATALQIEELYCPQPLPAGS